MTLIKKDISVNFQIKKGDSFEQSFEFVDCVAGVETPIDLTGSTVTFEVTDYNNIVFITGTTALTGSPANNIDVTILASDTNIYPTKYRYNLKVTGSGSPATVNTYIVGIFEILE
jgi:hypothetical protein